MDADVTACSDSDASTASSQSVSHSRLLRSQSSHQQVDLDNDNLKQDMPGVLDDKKLSSVLEDMLGNDD